MTHRSWDIWIIFNTVLISMRSKFPQGKIKHGFTLSHLLPLKNKLLYFLISCLWYVHTGVFLSSHQSNRLINYLQGKKACSVLSSLRCLALRGPMNCSINTYIGNLLFRYLRACSLSCITWITRVDIKSKTFYVLLVANPSRLFLLSILVSKYVHTVPYGGKERNINKRKHKA